MFFRIGHIALLGALSCVVGLCFASLVVWSAEKHINLPAILMMGCVGIAVVAYGIGWYQCSRHN